MIVKFSRADPGLIKYIRQGPATVNEFDTQRSTIFGHKNAVGAEAVGAAAYFNTPVIGSPRRQSGSSGLPRWRVVHLALIRWKRHGNNLGRCAAGAAARLLWKIEKAYSLGIPKK